MLNNKAFFVPTVMVYTFLFLGIITFMCYESLTYQVILSSYETEVYSEVAILKAKQAIEEYVNYDKKFGKVCEQEDYSLVKGNYKVDVQGICFLDSIPKPLEYCKRVLTKEKLELTQEEYDDMMSHFDKIEYKERGLLKKTLKKCLKAVEDIAKKNPEIRLIVEKVEKDAQKKIEEYIAFGIDVQASNADVQNVLLIYNFQDKKIKKVFHT